jgi:hypothetical protein
MTVGEILKLLGGSGVSTAIVFTALWLAGIIHTKGAMDDKNKQLSDKDIQIAELKEALRLERARGDSVVLTGQIVRDVMQSLHRELLLCSGG